MSGHDSRPSGHAIVCIDDPPGADWSHDPVPFPLRPLSRLPPVAADLFDTLRVIIFGLLVALALRAVLFQPFTIPSSSMEPGLVTGDYIVVDKATLGWSRASLPLTPPLPAGRIGGRTARRGEVVVFRLPRDPRQTWIKRVIGLPGDRVRVRDGVVFINDHAVPQARLSATVDHDNAARLVRTVEEQLGGHAYVTYDAGSGPGDDTPEYVVPAGSYFVMGDNRDNSMDSRWPREVGVGLLPADNLVGKARFVAASWKPGAGLWKPWTWLNLQWDRFAKPIR